VFEPSQLPPQAEPSLAQVVRAPCGAPFTAVQVPTLPRTSHAWHWPLQAALQQTPSTQMPPAHSPAPAQAVPRSLRNAATTVWFAATEEMVYAPETTSAVTSVPLSVSCESL
jgi:hypothetical protein